jgi:hypothetical protein
MIKRPPLSETTRTGAYHVERWTYDHTKWGVYHPCGVCLAVWDTRIEADADCERRIRESQEILPAQRANERENVKR